MELPKFIFVHIPKTAGTTFRDNVINKIYGDRALFDKTCKIDVPTKHKWILQNRRLYDFDVTNLPKNYANYDVIHSHFLLEKYKHLNRPFVTFLRDPVERIISHYFFYQVADNLYKDVSIRDFAKVYANFMSYMLGDDINAVDFIGLTEYFDESLGRFSDQFGVEVPPVVKRSRVNKDKKYVSVEDRKFIRKSNCRYWPYRFEHNLCFNSLSGLFVLSL